MITVKSAWSPRTIRIDPKDYLMIYPDCSTPRRLNLLFSRVSGCLLLDEPIANFLIGKYEGLEIDKPEETPAIIPDPIKPEPELIEPEPEPEPEPMLKPKIIHLDPDDYTPHNIVSTEEVPTISNPPKKGSKKK